MKINRIALNGFRNYEFETADFSPGTNVIYGENAQGKTNLIVAIGCTGGKHRSVTVANYLGDYLANNGYNIFINHRDINKDRISRQ